VWFVEEEKRRDKGGERDIETEKESMGKGKREIATRKKKFLEEGNRDACKRKKHPLRKKKLKKKTHEKKTRFEPEENLAKRCLPLCKGTDCPRGGLGGIGGVEKRKSPRL